MPWERNRIWIYDASHFTRAKRVAYAIVDVVTRYWIGYLLTSEMTSTQVQLLFATALQDQGLVDPATGALLGADGRPLERADPAHGSRGCTPGRTVHSAVRVSILGR